VLLVWVLFGLAISGYAPPMDAMVYIGASVLTITVSPALFIASGIRMAWDKHQRAVRTMTRRGIRAWMRALFYIIYMAILGIQIPPLLALTGVVCMGVLAQTSIHEVKAWLSVPDNVAALVFNVVILGGIGAYYFYDIFRKSPTTDDERRT
jgi:Na+-transporting methylmalonyl-CoA/oxaloacetate decarboxylase beta subunit